MRKTDLAKKRCVFLFGAGAVMAWGGPRTLCNNKKLVLLPDRDSGKDGVCCLTHAILASGFYCKSGKRISQRIFDILQKNSLKKDDNKDVNFETIINVIEELIFYYSKFDSGQTPSLLSGFLVPKVFLKDILNFKIKSGSSKHRCKIIFGNDEHDVNCEQETPEQVFLQFVMADLLDCIISIVDDYASNRETNDQVEKNSNQEINDGFFGWVTKNIDGDNILRMYTLNYDRIFKIILENRGMNVFEGFNCGASIKVDEVVEVNVQRILSDSASSIHYNLHGSAYWHIKYENRYNFPASEFYLNSAPHFIYDKGATVRQMDKGKNTLITNIITGYQKTVRTSITPFKQMLSAFDKDCFFANKLFIVGYGFGDEHINESIKTALVHNRDLRITIIDPGFYLNKIHHKVGELFSHSPHTLMPPIEGENHISYFEGNVIVIPKNFFEVF